MQAAVVHLGPTDHPGEEEPEPQPQALERAGVCALDRDPCVEFLPDPGHGEEQGGLDLSEVFLDGVDGLSEVEGQADVGCVERGEDALGHVAQRQVADLDVVVTRRTSAPKASVVEVRHAVGHVGVGEHRSLRRACRSRRVDERHHVVDMCLVHEVLDGVLMGQPMLPSDGQEVVPSQEPLVVVLPHTAGFAVEDLSDTGDLRTIDLEHPVDLFLVLGQVEHRPAVGQQVLDLSRGVGGVEADGDAAHSHRGEVQDQPLGPVL